MSDHQTMHAMAYGQYGDTEVLEPAKLPRPKVGPAQVLVRVRSASVNPVDWKLMSGGLEALLDVVFPVVPGWDVAGVVEEVGIDTPEYAVGDEVMAYARKDYVHGGTFAELVTVPVRALARKPVELDWHQAGALPLAGLTAYRVLQRLGVGAGETVLVHGAAGGVGSLGVQIARSLGARVIGTASASNHDRLRGYGVEAVEYGDGLTERVQELAPDGVDAVADFVGAMSEVSTAVLRDATRQASVADPAVLEIGGQWIWVRPDGRALDQLADLVRRGELVVPVNDVFPLDHLADAFDRSATGHVAGKIAVEVSRD